MEIDVANLMLRDIRSGLELPDVAFLEAPTQISGGYDTEIHRCRLSHAPDSLSGELILRIFPYPVDGNRAIREAAIQNALNAEGLLVPKVHLTVAEPKASEKPFIVMECVSGETLLHQDEPESSRLLGQTHGLIHQIDPEEVRAQLEANGIDDVFLANTLQRIRMAGAQFGWAREVITWLEENQPEEHRLSICHGDFHKLNVMQANGLITGILDWSNFSLMDATFDVANTKISFSILARYLTEEGDFEVVDLDEVLDNYLDAYEMERELDESNLGYYLTLRATMILFLAALKITKPYQHPMVVGDVCELIYRESVIQISPDDILD